MRPRTVLYVVSEEYVVERPSQARDNPYRWPEWNPMAGGSAGSAAGSSMRAAARPGGATVRRRGRLRPRWFAGRRPCQPRRPAFSFAKVRMR